jgi:DNA-binding NarL/FixJ family response regulator
MRRHEILQLITDGQTTKGIAHRLNVSVKTVETHRSQLMERLDRDDVPGSSLLRSVSE